MNFNKRRESDLELDRQIVDTASEFLISLEDRECRPRARAELNSRFFAWLKESPKHIRAFLEISHAYYILSDTQPRIRSAAEKPPRADNGCEMRSNVISLRHSKHSHRRADDGWTSVFGRADHGFFAFKSAQLAALPQPGKLSWSRWVAVGAAAAITIGASVSLVASSFVPVPSPVSEYVTQIGERSIMQFGDGSAVYLNTGSHLRLASGGGILTAKLSSGEAYFSVPLASRSLHLQIEGLQIDSAATQLDVRRDTAGTQISVLEGRLKLSCDCTPNEVVLAAGYQLRVGSNDDLSQIQPRKMTAQERDNLVGWRDGHLRFEGQSLAEVAKEFNRYNRRQLRVPDAELANLAIGGTFSANDVESFIAGLQKDFGVQARPADPTGQDKNGVILSRAASR